MSLKYSSTTADYLQWSEAMNLIRKLARDSNYKMSLLIALGCFTGCLLYTSVSFAYEDRENMTKTEALKDISFIARQGEVTALVGPSGSVSYTHLM